MRKIAHVNLARGFRGGERQTVLLIRELAALGYHQKLIVRPGSMIPKHLVEVGNLETITIRRPYSLKTAAAAGCALIHAHETRAAQFAFFCHLFRRQPYLITRRVIFPIGRNPFNLMMYLEAAVTVALSRAVQRQILSLSDKINTTVIPSAVTNLPNNPELLAELRDKYPDCFMIGTIGALEFDKGQGFLIEAARSLADDFPTIRFVLVGSGRDELKLRQAGSDLKNLDFTGFVENVGDYINLFDLFILPSLTEGLGSILLDVMQFGKPIIATRVGGIPEIIHDNQTGLLVPPANSRAIEEAIIRLFKDPVLAARLGRNGQKRSGNFSPARMARHYAAIYEEGAAYSSPEQPKNNEPTGSKFEDQRL